MSLPPPDKAGHVRWLDYKIATPAFRLTPLEKPDMSPYLVHMTGKQAIIEILKSERPERGLIKATLPGKAKPEQWYDSPVVCLTESPLFAIDAFRHIKFQRWQQDLRYGIGFSKEKLIANGVRPVFYAHSTLVNSIKKLLDAIPGCPESEFRTEVSRLITEILPLVHSLMEYEPMQGFMWEREWRNVDPSGFEFSYSDIEIVCCPEEERDEIGEILKGHVDHVVFVSSWEQYDDVRAFLKSRSPGWAEKISERNENDALITQLSTLKQERNRLNSYKEYALRLQNEIAEIEKANSLLSERIDEITAVLQKPVLLDYCCVCGCDFDEESGRIDWNEDEGEQICGSCYTNYRNKCDSDD